MQLWVPGVTMQLRAPEARSDYAALAGRWVSMKTKQTSSDYNAPALLKCQDNSTQCVL
jgi:hypothetical protein